MVDRISKVPQYDSHCRRAIFFVEKVSALITALSAELRAPHSHVIRSAPHTIKRGTYFTYGARARGSGRVGK